ncbi:MAG: hypothetical protein WC969_04230 [Elusimicrobiota bacterium]
MSQRSVVGWLILVAALAVPAVLFWNWWGKMKAQSPQESARKAAASAFGGLSSQGVPATPLAAGATAQAEAVPAASTGVIPAAQAAQNPPPSSPAPQASAVPPTAPAAPGAAALPPAGPAAPPAAPVAGQNPVPVAPGAAAPAAGQAAARSDVIEYNPSTNRDPTLSPVDIKRMAQEALQKELSMRQIMEEARRPKDEPKKVVHNEPPIETRIQLYGIIATPNGISALVNDSIVSEGDRILGATVKKITTGTVVFEYRKRTFIKRVSK